MTFKYRFILSFVLLEAFFITLIVTMNFVTINDSSKKLTNEKLDSNIEFLDQLLKVPVSIYDLATLDNLVNNTSKLDYVNSLVVLDSQNNPLSQQYNFKHLKLVNLLKSKENQSLSFKDENYEIRYKELAQDEIKLGSFYIVFDTSQNFRFIKNAMKNTGVIILIEIIISTILSYIIGSRLTLMLTNLAFTAKQIGEYKYPEVPYQDKTDEIGVLSKSMAQMLVDLKERREKLKSLAVELNNQKNELIEANKSKDDFLANMSHELKTPLNSINVISSVMMKNRKGKLDAEQVKNLKIINSCGKDLLFLINDVLDISKLEAGELILNYEVVDFQAMMNEMKDMIEAQIEQKGLTFIFNVPSNIKYIYSDKNRINQIIKNLLSNALKFTAKGNISLSVKDVDTNIEILVKDEGIGIAQEKLETIFDRFKQADGSTTRKYGGTGLGLAICKELSVLLGGDIFVKSKIDNGTIFKVVIPKKEEELDPSLLVEKKEEKVEVKNEKSEEVLLLNSDPLLFMSASIAIKQVCFLEQVSSIETLLLKVESKSYSYIIIDNNAMQSNQLLDIVNKYDLSLILICEDENSLDDEIKNISKYILEKPFDNEKLKNLIKG